MADEVVSDDGKRTEVVCTKVSERMALDLLRAATNDDRSISDFIYRLLRGHLYGIVSREAAVSQLQTGSKVYRSS